MKIWGPNGLLRGFLALAPADRVLFVTTWILLGLARLVLLVMPSGSIGPLLGRAGGEVARALSVDDERRARRIGRAVTVASGHTPWLSQCYPQALVAHLELSAARIPHCVSFGLRRSDAGELLAHAWVRAGGVSVTGGDPSSYTVVGTFGGGADRQVPG